MHIEEFIAQLRNDQLYLVTKDGKLHLKGDAKKMSDPLRIEKNEWIIRYIKENREALITYISNAGGASAFSSSSGITAISRLTPLQEGLLFHGIYDSNSTGYLVQACFEFRGLQQEIFERTWQQLLKSHTILRTAFQYNTFSVPVQCVYEQVQLPFVWLDLRHLGQERQQEEYIAVREADRLRPFDFNVAPLMRITMLQLESDVFRMIWTAHHIIIDGWSLPVLMQEFLQLYEAFLSGAETVTRDEDAYQDYILFLERNDVVQDEIYWRAYLKDLRSDNRLPFIETNAETTKGIGQYREYSLELTGEEAALIRSFAKQNHITLNTLIQGVWAYLLSRYTGQEDICYGVTLSGRPENLTNVERRVGLYINTIPFRAFTGGEETVIAWLHEIQRSQVLSREHQYASLTDIRSWAGLQGDLFDSLLVFENFPVDPSLSNNKWQLDVRQLEISTYTNYPLSLLIATDHIITIKFKYNAGLLNHYYVEMVGSHFRSVLLQMAGNAMGLLSEIELLGDAEREMILSYGRSEVDMPRDKTVTGLFEDQVRKNPAAIALVCGQERLSYRELDEKASLLAGYLKQNGIKSGDLVVVTTQRHAACIIGIMGILKAGAAFVPVDPAYPPDRAAYILKDSGCRICLADSAFIARMGTSEEYPVFVDLQADWEIIAEQGVAFGNMNHQYDPEQLVYTIYTSGSTGRPKGVMITHAALVDHVYGVVERAGLDECRSFALVTSLVADAVHSMLFSALLTGKEVHLLTEDLLLSGEKISEYLRKENIDCVKIVPSLWMSYADDNSMLQPGKVLIFGGEALTVNIIGLLSGIAYKGRVYNHYGPTETTIGKCMYLVDLERKYGEVPIGKPFSNTLVYILDKQQRLCPVGVAGELFIGGEGLAKGYLNLPAVTEEKFVKVFFPWGAGERLYKTGDLARWTLEGDVVYMGRADGQLKIRGFRIEPGEIENILLQCPAVRLVAIMGKKDIQGRTWLVAYVVPEKTFDEGYLLGWSSDKLPNHMIPEIWVEVPELPLMAHGKIDKKALPEPWKNQDKGVVYALAETPVQEKLLAIWRHLLKTGNIGIDDNFFRLGGHSLLVIRLIAAIRRTFSKEIAVKQIFDHPTIRSQALICSADTAPVLPPLVRQERDRQVPLSFAQERLWFIDRLRGSVEYNLSWTIALNGDLNIPALEAAFMEIVSRHEILRTVIREENGVGYQHALSPDGWRIQIFEEKELMAAGHSLRSFVTEKIEQPYDLSTAFMLRVLLIKRRDNEYLLTAAIHHIAADGWSVSILAKELEHLYNGKVSGRFSGLPALTLQYADYAIWQRKHLSEELLGDRLAYWKEQLRSVEPVDFSTDYPRPKSQSIGGGRVIRKVGREQVAALEGLARKEGVTMFMLLLGVFKVLIYRYTGQSELCVCSPVAGRRQQEEEKMIGFFVNTVPLHCSLSGNPLFSNFLQQLKQVTLKAYEYQDVPFERIIEIMEWSRDIEPNPLFQLKFALQNAPEADSIHLDGVSVHPEQQWVINAQIDISMDITAVTDGMVFSLTYRKDLYRDATIARIMEHYMCLLQSAMENIYVGVNELNMLDEGEKRQLLKVFPGENITEQYHHNVLHLFAEQVAIRSQETAVVYETESLTYAELESQSNRLANYLRSCGVREEVMVPVCLNRSLNMIVGILGILKAGGAYVPIDPEFPRERIDFILKDTGARIVVTSISCSALFYENEQISTLVTLDGGEELLRQSPASAPVLSQQDHLAYTIYTSGSTGTPKGVMMTHAALAAFVWSNRSFFSADTTAFLITSFTFDPSVGVILGTLSRGGKILLTRGEWLKAPRQLKPVLAETNLIICVPSYYQFLLEERLVNNTDALRVLLGGERLSAALVEKHFDLVGDAALYNVYGPTETCIWSTLAPIPDRQAVITIGRPAKGNRIYILDATGAPSPVGVPGELCIGGAQVARGYLNLPDSTGRHFTPDPFSEERGYLYKTGDLACWLTDGNIMFMGRTDEQVKIRGYRIEPGEIQYILQQAPGIEQGVVLASRDKQNAMQLLAYVVTGKDYVKEKVIGHLKAHLPEYMLPAAVVPVESIPLTANGKIDRSRLSSIEIVKNTAMEDAPRNETERKMVAIWQELLETDKVGIFDNFFELGGHSLLALRVISAMRAALGSEVAIKDIFDHPTIADLAEQIRRGSGNVLLPPVLRAGHKERIPLSFAQQRLWFIDQLQGSLHYHMYWIFRAEGELDTALLERSFREIVNRHEVLRTVIRLDNGHPYQYVLPAGNWKLEYASSGKNGHFDSREFVRTPFDLSKDHMLKVAVVRSAPGKHLLTILLHHIAFDNWSVNIMWEELVALYNGNTKGGSADLKALPVQYGDFAIWQHQHLQPDVLEPQLSYWKEQLREVTSLRIAADRKRVRTTSFNGGVASRMMGPEMHERLLILARREEVTLFMLLMAVYKVLLFRYTGQEDICIGSSITGRRQQELEKLIGFFINTLPFRTKVEEDVTFATLLQTVKRVVLEAFRHQDVPFEKIVESLNVPRDLDRNPVFQVLFTLQNEQERGAQYLEGIQLTEEMTAQVTAQFELSMNVAASDSGMQIRLIYDTDLYSMDTAEQMLDHYVNLLQAVLNDTETPVARLSMLSSEEERSLLLKAVNNTSDHYPGGSLVQLLEERAETIPGEAALISDGICLTYMQLQLHVHKLAACLQEKGVKEDVLVPICTGKPWHTFVGMLAVLKAGGAFVPVDMKNPAERINYILEDTAAIILLTDSSCSHQWPDAISVVEMDTVLNENTARPVRKGLTMPDQLAYVIYTSGSTGTPKGVMITHGSLMNYLWSSKQLYSSEGGKSGSYAHLAFTFDASITASFLPLLTGKPLVVSGKGSLEAFRDPLFLENAPYDFIKLTPSHLSILEAELGYSKMPLVTKKLVVGGEALLPGHISFLASASEDIEIFNEYGPTEATVGCCIYKFQAKEVGDMMEGPVPIGRPGENVRLYVLDAQGQLCPPEIIGELHIGGIQVARGYLNRPDLTAERFIPDIFSGNAGEKLYRTGDLVRWKHDGNLEYLGRSDDQVKIRGHRVEPAEVAAILEQMPDVQNAIVVAQEDEHGIKRLVAYMVTKNALDKEAIAAYARTMLPEYMVPAVFVALTEIPLTVHGKVDRKKLPPVEEELQQPDKYAPPGSELEFSLVKIWEKLFELGKIGIHDDFFALGGHSLLGIRMISHIEKECSLSIPIAVLFELRTIHELAGYIEVEQQKSLQRDVSTPYEILDI